MNRLESIEVGNAVVNMSNKDIFRNTRQRDYVELRALVCYVLREKLRMGWTDISRYFVSQGKKMDHATAIHLHKKYPEYKQYNKFLSNIEGSFIFNIGDKNNEAERINYLENKCKDITEKYNNLKDTINNNPKLNLLHDIPDDKLNDVIERLSLFKKSWSWKNKDHCEVLESY